jgi:hypothetical protein
MACTGDGGTWPSDGPYAPCARLLPLRRVRLVCSLPIPSLRSTAAAAQAERLSSATARAAPHQSCPFRPPQLTASLSILLQALPASASRGKHPLHGNRSPEPRLNSSENSAPRTPPLRSPFSFLHACISFALLPRCSCASPCSLSWPEMAGRH